MAYEIERKFLVRNEAWRSIATAEASVRQGYLASGERSTARVRIKNGSEATLTIKSKRAELRRLEIEYPISVLDARAAVALRWRFDRKDALHGALARASLGGGRVLRRQCRPC